MSPVTFLVRTDPGNRVPPTIHLLDAFGPHDPASTVWTNWNPTAGRPATPGANDLLWLSIATLAADTISLRSSTTDGWTRQFGLRMRLTRGEWAGLGADVERMLGFLTGDEWSLRPTGKRSRALDVPAADADTVCLFSGGLDSLVGAINLLAEDGDRRVLLVGVEDVSLSAGRQNALLVQLEEAFPGRVELAQTWARLQKPRPAQERALPTRREPTTRSRSLFFLASGLAAAAGIGPEVPLFVPENGFIGLNVPLVPARSGSLSTRTTHPHFLGLLREIASAVGVTNPVINPLRLCTKGEALTGCLRPDLLRTMAPESMSCAHPLAGRFRRESGSCGYCYPCLVRRASMYAAGLDDGGDYNVDVLSDEAFMDSNSVKPASLRASLAAIRQGSRPVDTLRNGPVPIDDLPALADLHARGLAELEAWLRTATARAVLALLP